MAKVRMATVICHVKIQKCCARTGISFRKFATTTQPMILKPKSSKKFIQPDTSALTIYNVPCQWSIMFLTNSWWIFEKHGRVFSWRISSGRNIYALCGNTTLGLPVFVQISPWCWMHSGSVYTQCTEMFTSAPTDDYYCGGQFQLYICRGVPQNKANRYDEHVENSPVY